MTTPAGPPPICSACRCLMHEPSDSCPEPMVCTYQPGECGDARCMNYPTPAQRERVLSAMDRKIAGVLANWPN